MPDSATPTHVPCRCARIRDLNDQLRTRHEGGRIVMTRSVMTLGKARLLAALRALACFDDFSPDNDPRGEHDMGALEIGATTVLWRIDYHDRNLEFASPDPADPSVTSRVLTLMLADEY